VVLHEIDDLENGAIHEEPATLRALKRPSRFGKFGGRFPGRREHRRALQFDRSMMLHRVECGDGVHGAGTSGWRIVIRKRQE
jgi:hypothetical protein